MKFNMWTHLSEQAFTGIPFPVLPVRLLLYRSAPTHISWAGMPVADTIMMTTKYMLSAIHTYQVRVSATWEMWRSYLSPVVTRSNRLRFSRKRRKKQRQAIMQYVSTISELMWSWPVRTVSDSINTHTIIRRTAVSFSISVMCCNRTGDIS